MATIREPVSRRSRHRLVSVQEVALYIYKPLSGGDNKLFGGEADKPPVDLGACAEPDC